MPFIRANDLNIYYETRGEGIPLILVGGFSQNHLMWEYFLPELSKHFQVIRFDNRGCGQTEAPEDSYSIKMFAEDTAALMEKLGIENAHFMGASMGTLIIQKMCLDHPDRVRKAVLLAPFSHFPPVSRNNLFCELKLLEQGISREMIIRLSASWLLSNSYLSFPENIDHFVSYVLSDPYPQTLPGLLGQADALFEADLRQDLKNIPHEILLLVGEKDIAIPLEYAEYMSQKLPNCKKHVFKEVGHLFSYEVPGKTLEHSLNFLLQK